MFSQRGVYNLGHTLQDMRDIERRVCANKLNGIDAEVVDAKQIKKKSQASIHQHLHDIQSWALHLKKSRCC